MIESRFRYLVTKMRIGRNAFDCVRTAQEQQFAIRDLPIFRIDDSGDPLNY